MRGLVLYFMLLLLLFNYAPASSQEAKKLSEAGTTEDSLALLKKQGWNYYQKDMNGPLKNTGRQILSLAEKIESDGWKMWGLNYLGYGHFYLSEYDSLELVLQEIEHLIPMLNEQKDYAEVEYYSLRLLLYTQKGQIKKVDSILREKLEELKPKADDQQLIRFYQLYARNNSDLGDKEEAIEYYIKTIELEKSQPVINNRNVALLENSLGETFRQMEDFNMAKSYYFQAYERVKSSEEKFANGIITNNLGILYESQEMLDSALYFYEQSLRIKKETGNRRGALVTKFNIASLHNALGAYEKAELLSKEVLKTSEELGVLPGVFYGSFGVVTAIIGSQDYPLRARPYLDKMTLAAERIGNPQMLAEMLEIKYRYYKRVGKPATALTYHEQLMQQKDSLQSLARNKQIDELNLKYQTEQRERENDMLKLKQTEQQASIDLRNLVLGAVGTILVLLMVILILQNQRAVERRKQNEALIAKNIEVEEANKELKTLNEEQGGLMHVVVHDLKSPLNSIYSILQLLEMEKGALSDKENKYYAMIYKVIASGQNLIKDLTDIHSVEKLQREMDYKKTAVEEFIAEIIELQQNKAEAKGISIHYEATLSHAEHKIDQDYIRRIIDNLLSNAIKFSPHGRNIYFNLSDTTDNIKISIKDEGPGFSEKDMENAFKKFQRLSASPTNGEHSSGLGLSIVKTLTERLNGTITLISEKGQGAEFIIEIPAEIIAVQV
ncbi:MAG TPA: ATP-binding protein [Cyclobacteriaceae bacterium]